MRRFLLGTATIATLLLTVLGTPAAAFGSPDDPSTAQPAVAPTDAQPPDSNVSDSGTALIPTADAAVALDDPATAHPAVAPAGANPPDSTGVSPADYYCEFLTRYDQVHYSSTAGDVSVHGWWDNVDCPAGTKAKVTTYLQEYYSDGSWRTKNTGAKTVYAGGGSANRSNARRTCSGSATVSWRGEVDVDLINISDSNNIGRTPTYNLHCVVN